MIDWQQIDEILTPGGDPIEVEIYREFLTATRDTLVGVERLLREQAPMKDVLWELHRVKGSCATFGLSGAAEQMHQWELKAKATGQPPTLDDMAVFMDCFRESLEQLKEGRPERMAQVFADPSPL